MNNEKINGEQGMHEISERIFSVLKDRGKKQLELAKHLQVSPSLVAKWKTPNYMPPLKAIPEICEYLNVPVEYILSGKGTNNPTESRLSPNLTEDENELIAYYRQFSDQGKGNILGNVKGILQRDFHL